MVSQAQLGGSKSAATAAAAPLKARKAIQVEIQPAPTSRKISSLPPAPPAPSRPSEEEIAAQDAEANADVDDGFRRAETYSDYMPAKLAIGHPHPDPVVETSSLSTVEPPDIKYKLALPEDVINNARLSSLQLESVVYASQQHEQMMADGHTRRGFLIGDGAGVGKGRTVAGIIYENYLRGREKSIWLSVSTDLRLDAIRDLHDVGLKEFDGSKVRLLKDFAYGKEIPLAKGVIFSTYSGLVSKSQSARRPLGTRLAQLIAWAGPEFDGLIVFDECHKAKSIATNTMKSTKTAECALEIQNKLPNARVVYASATGASEPRHLGYMLRLGMWGAGTAYPDFNHFRQAIEKRGIGAMELVAVDLKMRGSYIARQLSFKTTNFEIRFAPLSKEFITLYDRCVDLWALALRHFREAASVLKDYQKLPSLIWASFWAAHQKFFKYLCISAKVPVVVAIARQALEEGKCVVVGLQSTGEAKTLETLRGDDIDDFVSTAKATFKSLIENHFPVPASCSVDELTRELKKTQIRDNSSINDDNDGDKPKDHHDDSAADLMVKYGARSIEMRDELLCAMDKLAPHLPKNTLDDLVDRLGGPEQVAEMTGRKGRVIKDARGQISYRQRNEIDSLDCMNIAEKQRFMDGDKLVAIISEAASSGISLQADRRAKNQRRRVHITIELPWSADRAIQQFGRTHRSNQVSGPEYVFIISELAGERRFASIVAKRLESLGALTHGDRRATSESRDLSQFNIGSKFYRKALEKLNMYLEGGPEMRGGKIQPDYTGNFVLDARHAYVGAGLGEWRQGAIFMALNNSLESKMFLNRILGMKVRIQNAIFKLFTNYVDRLIMHNKINGQYDAGILELNSESGKTHVQAPEHFCVRTQMGNVMCTLRDVKVERGITWEEALELYKEHKEGRHTGFYKSVNPLFDSVQVYLIVNEGRDRCRVYKPNLGRQQKVEFHEDIIKPRDNKIPSSEAKKIWRDIYQATGKFCIHKSLFGSCKRLDAKIECDIGLRHHCYTILSGSILTIWPYLEIKVPAATRILRIVRLRLDEHNRVIGPVIPQHSVNAVKRVLRRAQTEGVEF